MTNEQGEGFQLLWQLPSQRLSEGGSSRDRCEQCAQREGLVESQMQGLNRHLSTVLDLFGKSVSEFGMALARLEALEAGFSELLRSEVPSGSFDDN